MRHDTRIEIEIFGPMSTGPEFVAHRAGCADAVKLARRLPSDRGGWTVAADDRFTVIIETFDGQIGDECADWDDDDEVQRAIEVTGCDRSIHFCPCLDDLPYRSDR